MAILGRSRPSCGKLKHIDQGFRGRLKTQHGTSGSGSLSVLESAFMSLTTNRDFFDPDTDLDPEMSGA